MKYIIAASTLSHNTVFKYFTLSFSVVNGNFLVFDIYGKKLNSCEKLHFLVVRADENIFSKTQGNKRKRFFIIIMRHTFPNII